MVEEQVKQEGKGRYSGDSRFLRNVRQILPVSTSLFSFLGLIWPRWYTFYADLCYIFAVCVCVMCIPICVSIAWVRVYVCLYIFHLSQSNIIPVSVRVYNQIFPYQLLGSLFEDSHLLQRNEYTVETCKQNCSPLFLVLLGTTTLIKVCGHRRKVTANRQRT
jgi:hypothetical protein